ncbi:hypothetical protein ACTA71_012474 [Dictyostelium dimigraforme]
MKQVITTLSLILLLLNISNGYEKLYISFTPYESSDCLGIPSGIGYGGLIDTCFSFDNSRNWLFKYIGEDHISFTPYENKGGVSELCEIESNSTQTEVINDCIPANDITFNSFYQPLYPKFEIYYHVQVGKGKPFIPEDSYVISHNYGNCDGDGDYGDIIFYETFSNQTQLNIPIFGSISEFYCLDGIPMTMTCKNDGSNCFNPQNQALVCDFVTPFFNTTGSDMSSSDSLFSINTYCS